MSNDLLKQLESKINEAIETIEFSRMEITDLKEKNDELENRYEDWEQRLSSLIEKFEQLEDVEVVEVEAEAEAEVDTSIQKDEKAEEVVAEEAEAEEVEAEEVVAVETEDEEVEAEEVVAVETEDEEAEADTEEFEGDELEGSTFGTSADSYTEAPGSSQHYA